MKPKHTPTVHDPAFKGFMTQVENARDSPPYLEHIVQQLSEQADKHQEVIVNIAQRLQDKGRQEGLQQGIEKGRKEGIREAKIMMARN